MGEGVTNDVIEAEGDTSLSLSFSLFLDAVPG